MAFQAIVVQVMIASPGDVIEERQIIRETLHDWNDVNATSQKAVLLPVGWDSHSSPELGSRPQELINSRLLKNCDLLVGVFWTRIGSPTGRAVSGTVEEIQEHVASGKPAMLYFSTKPAAPDSIDPEQYKSLKEFKEWARKNGLIEEFDSTSQLRAKLGKQLPICLLNNDYVKSIFEQTNFQAVVKQVDNVHTTYALTSDAAELLRSAASNQYGHIISIRTMDGQQLKSGDRNFGDGSAREGARWISALRELVKQNLVQQLRSSNSSIYELTHAGWIAADEL